MARRNTLALPVAALALLALMASHAMVKEGMASPKGRFVDKLYGFADMPDSG